MNPDLKEKRLMEAFASYESGESLATLQTVFSDVAVELNQMVEAEQILKTAKKAIQPSSELARSILAATSAQSRQRTSFFASSLWRLAAPVGIAAIVFMFVLSYERSYELPIVATEQAADSIALRAEPMMAKDAELAAPSDGAEMSFLAMDTVGEDEDLVATEEAPSSEADKVYLWQMISLGLLCILSALVLYKHWLARATTRTP